jgi:hypothetical protein
METKHGMLTKISSQKYDQFHKSSTNVIHFGCLYYCETMTLHLHNKKTEKQIAEISNGPSFKSFTAFQNTYEKLYKRGLTNKALGG